ncbi:hypothetical protein FEM48_Zijuj04G0033300 [Ziziphus jujuba var. spinosa]|uniref:CRM domain-containing protein n=1 Tax=Ziziphus jujuba var. spinosa TaxID=714518 RepID=A0A978VHJ1_ZIZJJ|nr:hypothetical protein FEM48_Zijuj04G0033300 [Ziziphus jujuba var. spinosa]
MLLPLAHLSTTSLLLLPNKTLPDQSLLKTQISPNPKPINFLVRSSTTDAQTQALLPKSAIQRIAEKLRNLGFTDENVDPKPVSEPSRSSSSTSAGEIFVPLPERLAKSRVGHTIDSSWSTPENPVPEPGTGSAIARFHELRNEVKKQKKESAVNKKKESVPTLAELSLPKEELRRLTTLGIALRKKLKIGKAGITEGIVNGIHERWRRSEVVRIVCDDLSKLNMKRTHDLLERKTGGLVVWRAGSKIVLYRGINYKYPYFLRDTIWTNDTSDNALLDQDGEHETCSSSINGVKSATPIPTSEKTQPALIQGVGLSNRVRFQLPGEAQLAEEADRLLDGLGPRFTDWWGHDPLPIDADLLPAVVPGYRRPFRLLPYGVKPKLTDDEMTTLRRLARPLPCHFALGRNRNLQGLASSIVKLWEKCEIAKIAIKRGVQNTNSEMMAEELKCLTGGTLLARDREFIVLYRGKDFLPPAVSSAIEERRKYRMHMEKQRTETNASTATTEELKLETVEHGTEHESRGINEHKTGLLSGQKKLRPTEKFIKRTSIKLSMAIEKREKAEKLLAELEKAEIQQQPDIDKEGITEEERYMLRKIGLRMKPFLLLGRRGVFDGTVENMHLHWKYRELIKIITNGKTIEDVHQVARTLEAESGGILVAVERVNKGYAIIIYRGKNYKRPASLRPQTLLNKRQAMKRFIEAQRRESLKLHVLRLNKNIDDLKLQLVKDKDAKEIQSINESSKLVREEIKGVQSSEDLSPNPELKSGSLSHLGKPACNEEIFQARDENRAHYTPINLKDGMGTSIKARLAAQQDKLIDSSQSCDGNETGTLEPRSSYESNGSQSDLKDINCAVKAVVTHCVSNNETMESSSKSNKNDSEQSVPSPVENGLSMSSRATRLSNKERLLLRRQALKMKKRPVLAVGKSNIVTGVAKAIKAHFEKHPLAIVNVKGRAKGTSVQEVVFKLEQATGAVLVSQEPSKVILYRGWGAEDTSECTKKNLGDAGKKVDTQPVISPELLAAIKLECGLQSQETDASP